MGGGGLATGKRHKILDPDGFFLVFSARSNAIIFKAHLQEENYERKFNYNRAQKYSSDEEIRI
jgi:hypothetical protein